MQHSTCGRMKMFYSGKTSSLVMFSVPVLIEAILATAEHRANDNKELLTQHGLDDSKAPQSCFGEAQINSRQETR